MQKVYRLWKPIELKDHWTECDTSILDDISSSWFERRKKLKEDSGEYADFLNRLKREHAIETGVIERLYDLNKGVTETFINDGFIKSFLSHGDTNISDDDLISHLNDHLDSVNFIFDIVKENRPLSISFIKELHQLMTRNQKYAEGRDQFGNKLKTELLKGQYKQTENNPTREDGTQILYCSPDHIASEMDNLILISNENAHIHPLILATWFHHAFTTIHPFQDGNGRMARLLTSLIFIKHGLFPFTVLRAEAKVKYIEALEKADNGNPQDLISYFGEVQKRNIQKALNLKDVNSASLEKTIEVLANKVEIRKHQKIQERLATLGKSRIEVFNFCREVLNELMESVHDKMNGNAEISIASSNEKTEHYFYKQIISYAKMHDYFFNKGLPKAWLMFKIGLEENKKYQLGISIHHYGYDDTTIAIGSFLEFKGNKMDDDDTIPLNIEPHVISISENIEAKKKNIRSYLEHTLAIALAQIASEL
ncbi:Fic family protein [Candidatus Thiomargarita nelsonii]|uniref:Fic family protein n=1 Tax=Candidatus Thiomargarita nelsonii TaxID=1003181 RepID=A0A0A6P639_9GAMM|nr:Fic family protein [Candidatus Thiomargarita nelsonii]